jgi:hypothetical protein
MFQNVFAGELFGSAAAHSSLLKAGTLNTLKVRPACHFVTQRVNRF